LRRREEKYGTKLAFVLRTLVQQRRADPRAKSVVFSQWNRLLQLVERTLVEHGFSVALLFGRHADSELDRFRSGADVTVLLVSMRSGGGAAGLTLTMASTAFILEPSVNVSAAGCCDVVEPQSRRAMAAQIHIEDQAVGRLHRIGQSRRVVVHRVLTQGTVEAKIVRLQDRKRAEAAAKRSVADKTETLNLEEAKFMLQADIETL
jgi:SNF2 family DNA or RNA helicase